MSPVIPFIEYGRGHGAFQQPRGGNLASDRVQRRLTAILAADVAGYSRLMGLDEAGTARTLHEHRAAVDPIVAHYGGRIVKTTGDGVLLEFPSIVAAVDCAVVVQNLMRERNRDVPEELRMLFRIGINLGDVLIDGDDILGDGVNIAARLEGIAEPGGICVSEDVFRQVSGKLDVSFEDIGNQQLKNIARPVHAYRARFVDVPTNRTSASLLPLPDKPSIAVLPFQNMSGDPEQESFADGMVEDITTSLSKVRQLFVIARNSTFMYKNRALDVRQVARELGVRYVLEGSVRRSGDRLRITAQLIEAASGNHIWAERYDRAVRDVFDVQDEITKEIVLALSVELTAGERALVFSRSTRSLEAWLEAMRGFGNWTEGSPIGIREALTHFERAVAIDPDYTIAWAFIGWIRYTEVRFGLSADPQLALAKAAEIAEKCLAMSPDEPHAHGLQSGVWAVQGRFEDAVRESEIAIAASPSDAWLRCVFGRVLVQAGYSARGALAVREAMQLNPFHPIYYFGVLANALEELGQNVNAIEVLTEAVCREPNYFAGHLRLASLYGLTDQIDEARAELAAALRINPRFTMALAEAFYASSKIASSERFKLGLRKAGLPE
jgi:adenylate cyclase